ncbi:hypothetical protein MRX96_039469 [Rhipicephalus microplus]
MLEILNKIITFLRSDEWVPVYFTELFPTRECGTKLGRLNVLLKHPVFIHLSRLVGFGSQYRLGKQRMCYFTKFSFGKISRRHHDSLSSIKGRANENSRCLKDQSRDVTPGQRPDRGSHWLRREVAPTGSGRDGRFRWRPPAPKGTADCYTALPRNSFGGSMASVNGFDSGALGALARKLRDV